MMPTYGRRQFLKTVPALGAVTAFGRVFAADDVLKVGVGYVSPVAEVGWTKQHDLARRAMEVAFPGRIKTTSIEGLSASQDAERAFRQLAQQGHRLIFGTSFSHGTPLQRVAQGNSGAFFEHCSGIKRLTNLGTFEARYYEGTYLAGVLAGKMTKTNTLGFIGGYPVPDVLGAANAMLLGARSVNPKVSCRVIWLNSWFDPGKEKEAANALGSQGADVLVSMTDTPTTVQYGEEKGLWTIGYASDMSRFGPARQLTSFTLDWSSVYIGAARDVLAGTWTSKSRWDGLKAGVVKMSPYNRSIPKDVLGLVAAREKDIVDTKLHPFAGPINDQKGTQRVAAGTVLSDDEIRSINWFVEGMQGMLG
jgi:basic membrane protein A and related proteins